MSKSEIDADLSLAMAVHADSPSDGVYSGGLSLKVKQAAIERLKYPKA